MNYHRHKTADTSGFSLVEITIAMSIAAIALISLVGILPTAMKGASESGDQTAIGTMLEDIHDRIEGSVFEVGFVAASPFFYDQRGVYIYPDQTNSAQSSIVTGKFYRVEVELVKPAATGDMKTGSALAVKVEIYWPIDSDGKAIFPDKPGDRVTYLSSARTGPGWEVIDSSYQPRIEY